MITDKFLLYIISPIVWLLIGCFYYYSPVLLEGYRFPEKTKVQAEISSKKNPNELTINGLNFVGPPKAFPSDPMSDVLSIHANWIAVIPYAYTRPGEAAVHYNVSNFQWWGERPAGIIETIRLAHEAGLKVLLKPQLYVPGSWPGALDFSTEKEWVKWEGDYKKYLMTFVHIADSMDVEMLAIGTEFKHSVKTRLWYWEGLICDVKSVYNGLITYAANWDSFDQLGIWKDVDVVGIDAYFPLLDTATPDVDDLNKAWEKVLQKIRAFQHTVDKPIVFTEYGYLSVDGCAYNTWELEERVMETPINEEAQANAIQSVFETFSKEDYWIGGFLWKWFPHMKGHEGYVSRDYTPQGKKAENVIRHWHKIRKE